ncbi:MAG TPA: radical SAM protein [Steroidobacteraceae bacterium]|jgi:anaerobic magnesium-protoporphyrin IX monomethyl ester cyclase
MLSVLVAHSYFLRFDQKQWQRAKPYPPLATLQVASTLRRAGHTVAVFDAMLAEDVSEFAAGLKAANPQLTVFYEDTFNFLSKMCLGKMRQAACQMIAQARAAGSRVIVAGPDATDAPEAYLAAGADVVLLGEGLATLNALIDRLNADPRLECGALVGGLSGVASRAAASVTIAKGGTLLPVSEQPVFPAWDLIDLQRYRAVWLQAHGYFSLNMAASRGCSFRCNWCAKPTWGNHYLQRDADNVAREMAYLKEAFNPDHIWFADDVFGFRVDWVKKFAAAVQFAQCSIPITIQTRADLLSASMAQALKAANCREVWIGAESGSQRILDSMNKGTTVEEIALARMRLRNEGIRVGFFIQLGYLDEQLDDLLATRALIDATRPDDIGVSVSYPLPGTRFYELVKSQLQGKTHWHESNDLEMMFRGTYNSEFYRAVRDLLHSQVTSAADETAMRALRHRWDALISRERHYRNVPLGGQTLARAAVNEA